MSSLIDSRYNFAKRSLFCAGVSSASSSPLSLGSTSSALRSKSSRASDPLPPECKSSSTVRSFPFPFADTRPLLVRNIFLLEDGPESLEDTRFRFRVFLEEKNESGMAPWLYGAAWLVFCYQFCDSSRATLCALALAFCECEIIIGKCHDWLFSAFALASEY
jgi:hypothetical protein